MKRLPLSLRLAFRELSQRRAGSLLAAVFLAIPTTALIVANIVADNSPANTWTWALTLSLTASLTFPAALIVTIMVGANLLVAARRNERMLALLSSVGASPGKLFRVVSATGIATGLAASVISIVLGVPLAWLVLGRVASVNVVAVIALALLAIVLGWLASVVPAIAATSLDTVRILRDIPKTPRSTWKASRVGRMLVAIGLAMLLVGGVGSFVLQGLFAGQQQPSWLVGALGGFASSALTGFGTLVALVGILMTLPGAFGVIGRALGRHRLALRLAARDAERGWSRSVSAGAAVLVTTFLVGSYLTLGGASTASTVEEYIWSAQKGQVLVNLIDPGFVDETLHPHPVENIEAVAAAVEDGLEVTDLRTIHGVQGPFYGFPMEDVEGYSGRQAMAFPPGGLPHPQIAEESACEVLDPPDWRCADGAYYDTRMFPLSPIWPTIWVGDAADLRLILGGEIDQATLAALDRGDALVFDAQYLSADETVTISWHGPDFVPEDEPDEFLPAGDPLRSETLPGVLVPLDHWLHYGIFVSEDAADRLGLVTMPARLLGTVPDTIDAEARTAAIEEIANAADSELWLDAYIEIGPGQPELSWTIGALMLAGGILLAVALVAVGLAAVDGRTTQRTLAALGADPSIRRRMSAWYALIVVGYPALCGTVFALVAGLISFSSLGSAPAGIPLLELGLLAVGVPLLAAGAAWVVSARPRANRRQR